MERAIFEIADALEMGLRYNKGIITGTSNPREVTIGGTTVTINPKVKNYFTNGGQVGVIVHLLGDLHVMVVMYKPSSVLSAYVIDGSMVNLNAVDKTSMSLQDIIALLRNGITASFFKRALQSWAPLTLPKD